MTSNVNESAVSGNDSGSGLFIPISNDGHMTVQQMMDELSQDRVVPILAVEQDGTTYVPLFNTVMQAWKFARRNVAKHCTVGTWEPSRGDLQQMQEDGLTTKLMHFPAKRTVSVLPFTLRRELEVRVYGDDRP